MMPDWSPAEYSDLIGWSDDDHLAALTCFRMSARAFREGIHETRIATPPSEALLHVASEALDLDTAKISASVAKDFFEKNFRPKKLAGEDGFVTAYFEPEVPASRKKTTDYPYPLYRRPADLVKISDANRPRNWSEDLEYARKTDQDLIEYYDRKAIDQGALQNQGLELFWLRSAIEAFYIHVQGSARLIFEDGDSARVSYAGKTGHPYTSIGKVMVSRGILPLEKANMENIRDWLEQDIDRALEVLHQNRSYIFFAEAELTSPDFGPVAAAGVQLTPGRSLAVDRNIHAYGTPVWISTKLPLPADQNPLRRLMIAQDTGSAIVGPKRGDIFIGSGDEAGMVAGSVRHETEFIILEPELG